MDGRDYAYSPSNFVTSNIPSQVAHTRGYAAESHTSHPQLHIPHQNLIAHSHGLQRPAYNAEMSSFNDEIEETASSVLLRASRYPVAPHRPQPLHQPEVDPTRNPYSIPPSAFMQEFDAHISVHQPQSSLRYSSSSEANPYPSDSYTTDTRSAIHPMQSLAARLMPDDFQRSSSAYVSLQNTSSPGHMLQPQYLLDVEDSNKDEGGPPYYPSRQSIDYINQRSPNCSEIPLNSHPPLRQNTHGTSAYDSPSSVSSVGSYNPKGSTLNDVHSSNHYRATHTSSSIPMSNSTPRHPPHDANFVQNLEQTTSLRSNRSGSMSFGRNSFSGPATLSVQQANIDTSSRLATDLADRLQHISANSRSLPSLPRLSDSPSDSESTLDEDETERDHIGGERVEAGQRRDRQEKRVQGTSPSAAPKKKKKSKMHECEICQKKFPRPSGLRTHMNTHSNAKPYPCGFPGCNRAFGVRSNAKRHLRTHGVVPSPPTSSTTDAPYVVGFSTPVVLPSPPTHTVALSSIEPRTNDSESYSEENGEYERGLGPKNDGSQQQHVGRYKLRWLPPSSNARNTVPKEMRDRRQPDRDDEDEGRVSMNSANVRRNVDSRNTSRLPGLRPVLPSLGVPPSNSLGLDASRNPLSPPSSARSYDSPSQNSSVYADYYRREFENATENAIDRNGPTTIAMGYFIPRTL